MTGEVEELEPLKDMDEVLLRQVHPDQYLEDGTLSSVAFRPSAVDEGMLSTRRAVVGAALAFTEWQESRETAGTWGVAVGEASELELPCFDDSHLAGQPVGHASIDFRAHSSGATQKKARKLRDAAQSRGRLHP